MERNVGFVDIIFIIFRLFHCYPVGLLGSSHLLFIIQPIEYCLNFRVEPSVAGWLPHSPVQPN